MPEVTAFADLDPLGEYCIPMRFSKEDIGILRKRVLDHRIDHEGVHINVLEQDGSLVIICPRFPTHFDISSKKQVKANGQRIYDGSLNRFARATFMINMKRYLTSMIPVGSPPFAGTVKILMQLTVPHNYGSSKKFKGKLRWKQTPFIGSCDFDLDNQWIWMKAFLDAVVSDGILLNDNCGVIPVIGMEFHQCEHIDDREIRFTISPIQWFPRPS